jgi:hypothetical protein
MLFQSRFFGLLLGQDLLLVGQDLLLVGQDLVELVLVTHDRC